MSNEAEITREDRIALGGELAGHIQNFFLNQQGVYTVAGNRIAGEKTKQLIGRVCAAVLYPGKLDGQYLMLARRLEVEVANEAQEALDGVFRSWIKAVD